MDIKGYVEFMFKSNQSVIRKLLDDVDDRESLVRGKDNLTHIRWNAGHLANTAGYMVKILGDTPAIPQGWDEIFRGGHELPEDDSVFPAMDEIRKVWSDNYEKCYSALKNISMEELETIKEISPGWNVTPLEAVLFLVRHEFYHAGQIASLRLILGRERAFG